jgi:hypothetical protein
MKNSEYIVIDDFLEKEFFFILKSEIEHEEFPWRRRVHCTPNSKVDKGYFTHSIFNQFKINSPGMYENTLLPILNKLKAKSIIEARVNMFLSEFFLQKYTIYHQDYPFNSNTAILNFTDCDGGTSLKINNKEIKVKSKENRIVIFNSLIKHRTIKPSNSDIRYILNLNYF